MASPLTHGLVAAATFGGSSVATGRPAVSVGLLLAAVISMLADLDESEDHVDHSPWGHSLLVLFAGSAVAAVLGALAPLGGIGLLPAILAGLGTLLLLDVFSVGGIYAWPRRTERGWRWAVLRWRLRFGDDDPFYNLCAVTPAAVGLVAVFVL